jgi:integrase
LAVSFHGRYKASWSLHMKMTKFTSMPLTNDVVRLLPHGDAPYILSDLNQEHVYLRVARTLKSVLINVRLGKTRLVRKIGQVTDDRPYEYWRERARKKVERLKQERAPELLNPTRVDSPLQTLEGPSARAHLNPETPLSESNQVEQHSANRLSATGHELRERRSLRRPKLTNSAVEKFTCRPGRVSDILWCGELRGFGVRVSASSRTRTYILHCRIKGRGAKKTHISIGRHNDPWRVDDARKRALGYKAQMLDGIDPLAEQGRDRKADVAIKETLEELMEDYVQNHKTKHGSLRPATQRDIRRHCNENLAEWLSRPWSRITRDMCIEKFRRLSSRAPTQANTCMRYLRAILNWGREKYATEDGQYPVLAINPVTRLFKLQKPNPTKAKRTRIPLNKVGLCWLWLRGQSANARTQKERCAADWVSTLLLSGMRREESASIRKADVDLDKREITLHGDVHVADVSSALFAGVKNHNTFVLPMSTTLHEIVSARLLPPVVAETRTRRRPAQVSTEYVFATSGKKKPYIGNAPKVFKALSDIAGTHVHPHAIRRTFEDIAQECRIGGDLRRLLLNHATGDVHATHYSNNVEAMPAALEKIAQWVVEQAAIAKDQASGADVVPLRAKPTPPDSSE